VEAIGKTLEAVGARDARGFFSLRLRRVGVTTINNAVMCEGRAGPLKTLG